MSEQGHAENITANEIASQQAESCRPGIAKRIWVFISRQLRAYCLSKAPWIGFLIVLADQLSKYWVVVDSPVASPDVAYLEITPFLSLVNMRNYGISFSMFSEISSRTLIMGSSFFVVVIAMWMICQMRQRSMAALSLIVWGALGNIIDRVNYGYVIDFIDFHLADMHYPAFNFADSAIVIGGMLFSYSEMTAGPNRCNVEEIVDDRRKK